MFIANVQKKRLGRKIKIYSVFNFKKSLKERNKIMKHNNYYTPAEIINRAKEHMVVLETQKAFTEQMASMLSMHIAKVQAMENNGYSFEHLPSASCFILSPTGTGKSYILKALAKASNMNVSFIDSTQLTQSGYKGLNITQAIAQIVETNQHFFDKANMLVFDEFDKTFFSGCNSHHDAFNVQRDLLKLFEGSEYCLRGAGDITGRPASVNLDKTLIVLAGACSGINAVLEERYAPKAKIGFSTDEGTTMPKEELIKRADINDLVEYGMLREIAGRVNSVFHIGNLSKEDYKNIATSDSKVSTLTQYRNLFKSRGCQLHISGSAVDKIADVAEIRCMGARTVNAVLNEQLCAAYSFLESHFEYDKAILDTNADNEFVLTYEKGEREVNTAYEPIEEYLLYNFENELVTENSIDMFCNEICFLAKLTEPNKETYLYSFLQLVCRYFMSNVRPSERTVENLIKLARATERCSENSKAPFDIICEDFLMLVNKRTVSEGKVRRYTPEFIEAFEVFFEIYKENCFALTDVELSNIISQATKRYVNNKTVNSSHSTLTNK